MLPSVRPCRPHSRLSPPGFLRVPLPSVRAKSGLQGFAPTGSPGFGSLGCGLVVCLRSFGFRLATDTLPFSAIARTQLGEQVFHLLENNTAGHTRTVGPVRGVRPGHHTGREKGRGSLGPPVRRGPASAGAGSEYGIATNQQMPPQEREVRSLTS
jgi:hypothetical protein